MNTTWRRGGAVMLTDMSDRQGEHERGGGRGEGKLRKEFWRCNGAICHEIKPARARDVVCSSLNEAYERVVHIYVHT